MLEKFINNIHKIATGDKKKRRLLAPLGALLFFTLTAIFVVVPLTIDNALQIPRLVREPWNLIISIPPLLFGLFLVIWTNSIFFRSKGTPVPLNPPPVLIKDGPFAYSRNPMTTGVFLIMFAIGFYFGSVTSVLVFTPIYILIGYLLLKFIEEPELERRLGSEYTEYKKSVPMFFPRMK